MTHRISVAAFVLLLFASFSSPLFAQGPAAAPAQGSAPAKAKWMPPVKGEAAVEIILGKPKRVGNDLVNVTKIKNTSTGPIALLGVEEFWYDQKGKVVSGDSQKVKRLLNPGEIVEVTTKSPWKAEVYSNNLLFTHANGKIKATKVTKFTEKK